MNQNARPSQSESKPGNPNQGRFALWLIVTILSALLLIPLANFSFSLISAQDDIAVASGVVLLALLIGAVVWLSPKLARKLKNTGRVIAALALLSLASCERINAGYAGIKVNNYGTQRGVQDAPLVTGLVWYNPLTQSVFEYPCFVQTGSWDKEEALTFNIMEAAKMPCGRPDCDCEISTAQVFEGLNAGRAHYKKVMES